MTQFIILTFLKGIRAILFMMLVLLAPGKSVSQDKVKNVAIFFSYGPNLPAFEKILTGLTSTIGGNTNEHVNLMIEYLDMNRAVNDDYSKFIINLYNHKLDEITVDLLITVGPGINQAILKYGGSRLRSLKMINVDLDLPQRTTFHDLGVNDGKEILLKFKPDKTLSHAFDLFPDNHDVFVISGVSRLDSIYSSMVRRSKDKFEPTHHFRFISGLTLDSTIRFVRTIPPKGIVLVPSYFQDAANVSFSTPEVMEMISKNSPAPVFLSITDAGFIARGGGIGGYLFSYVNLGEQMGRIAHQALTGKEMKYLTVDENSFYEHIYDWNELKRWHLTNSKWIPPNSLIYNRNFSLLDLYKWWILGILAFILSQTFLILYLIRLNKRQKIITKKMQETESMYRELVHTDRVSKMSILTASLSHELFQPLAAIKLTALAGKQFVQADRLDKNRASEMFDNILEDETRATKLIRSVKSLMKAETADKENINLNALIDDTINLIQAEAKKRGIKISVLLEDYPVHVLGDKIQLQQVLMNFIRNAVTAMDKNNQRDKMLEIVLRVIDGNAKLSVRDSGPGLDPALKEKLFKPFVSTKEEGFGIGLTLCKSLIEKHNGKIWGENIPGGGAIFSFSLPVIKNQ